MRLERIDCLITSIKPRSLMKPWKSQLIRNYQQNEKPSIYFALLFGELDEKIMNVDWDLCGSHWFYWFVCWVLVRGYSGGLGYFFIFMPWN